MLDKALGIRGVVDRKAPRIPEALGVPAQDAHAGRVEGAGPDIVRLLPQHQRKPLLELPRRLVGKGDGEDAPGVHGRGGGQTSGLVPAALQQRERLLIRVYGDVLPVPRSAVFEQLCDAVDEYGGFPAPRPRDDQQRPLRRQHGLLLHGIERGKIAQDQAANRLMISFFKISHHGCDSTTSFVSAQARFGKTCAGPQTAIDFSGAYLYYVNMCVCLCAEKTTGGQQV